MNGLKEVSSSSDNEVFSPHICCFNFSPDNGSFTYFCPNNSCILKQRLFFPTNSGFYIFLDNDRFCTSLRTTTVFTPLQVTVESDLSSDRGCLFFITRQQLFSYASAHKKNSRCILYEKGGIC